VRLAQTKSLKLFSVFLEEEKMFYKMVYYTLYLLGQSWKNALENYNLHRCSSTKEIMLLLMACIFSIDRI